MTERPTTWLDGLRDRASALVAPRVLEYVGQGSAAGISADEATEAWRDLRFQPRVLRDVRRVELGTQFLDFGAQVPWGVAPTTLQRQVHPEGELAMARACAEAGTPMVVSSNAGTRFDEIGATGVAWWVQCYLPQDRSLALPLLARAVTSGARAVVLTLDTPVVATKRTAQGAPIWDLVPDDQIRVNFEPDHDRTPGHEKAQDLSGADIAWLTERTGLPVVAKGVLHPADALACRDAGAAGIWVSNHGGRQLDRSVATARVLPAVRAAVPDVPVWVDGGLRSAHDLLAALALGADGMFLGRMPLWALAEGSGGVARLHAELGRDLTELLRLVGADAPSAARGTGYRESPTPL